MISRKVIFTAFALLLYISMAFGQTLPIVKPETVGLSSERLARLDKVLKQYTDEKKIPGAVALILVTGR